MPDKCTNCSATLDADANFCPSCSAPVSVRCPRCEKPVGADAKFCKYCAHELRPAVSTEPAWERGGSVGTGKSSVIAEAAGPTATVEYTGVDKLMAEKFSAMSEFQLLAFLKDDITGQSPKTLSMALAELESRPKIDWRDLNLARSRVADALAYKAAASGFGSPMPDSYYSREQDERRRKAGTLIKVGVALIAISLIAMIWGVSYTGNTANQFRAGLNGMVGQKDPNYEFAQFSVVAGVVGFIIGIVIALMGVGQKNSK